MRVSPCGYYATSLDEALDLAKQSAEVTHNHPEGIKGAQAIALAIFLARQHKSKDEIRPTYGIPSWLVKYVTVEFLPQYILDIIEKFDRVYADV